MQLLSHMKCREIIHTEQGSAVAATDAEYTCLERQPHKVAVRLCAALKLTEKNKLSEVEGARAPVPHNRRRQWAMMLWGWEGRHNGGLVDWRVLAQPEFYRLDILCVARRRPISRPIGLLIMK